MSVANRFSPFLASILILGLLTVAPPLALAQKPNPVGIFADADFVAPDYGNGGAETLAGGATRLFNYTCTCGNAQPGCNGTIELQRDDGTGFASVASDACSVRKNSSCSASHTETFTLEGTYTYRVFCDEATGTDYVQPAAERVIVTVKQATCVAGETRLCPLQEGVCAASLQYCVGGSWAPCDYGPNYESPETGCDGLDNDCDGLIDDVDADNDGFGACEAGPGTGTINELLITGLGHNGAITVYEYTGGSYNPAWSTVQSEVTASHGGGEAGDLNHDGIPEFVLTNAKESDYTLEVWSLDTATGEWYPLWSTMNSGPGYWFYVGDIADFDGDGRNELLVTNRGNGRLEVYGTSVPGGSSFAVEAVVKDCGGAGEAMFHAGSGDLDGDGLPEIAFQCYIADPIEIFEYEGGSYVLRGSLPAPPSRDGGNGVVDDMEGGDVNHDGRDDIVFCGNSGSVHVLTYTSGVYFIEFSAPVSSASFTQTCGIGDVTNDGALDFFDVSSSVRVWTWTHDKGYVEVWNSGDIYSMSPVLGSGFAGDSDNDGFTEFLYGEAGIYAGVPLRENDVMNASSFPVTHYFPYEGTGGPTTIIVADLDPTNNGDVDCNDTCGDVHPGAPDVCGDGVDQDCDGQDTACSCQDNDQDGASGYNALLCPAGTDCNDGNATVNPLAPEVCDGVDNNCDGVVDEGCTVCGDGVCAGQALGEDAFMCQQDCPCIGRDCTKGNCGDYTCSRWESAATCPVDCR